MPYGRCIETWARERSIALIPPHGSAKPGKKKLTGRSIELYRDFLVQKVAFFKTLSKKHEQGIDFKTAALHFLRCSEGLLRGENGALEVAKQLPGSSPREE